MRTGKRQDRVGQGKIRAEAGQDKGRTERDRAGVGLIN